MFGLNKKLNRRDAIKQELADVARQREAIIEASTQMRLQKLATKEQELRAELLDLDQLESSIKSSSQPSDEEQALWLEIRELMDRESSVVQSIRGGIPQKYIRPDAVEFYTAELRKQREAFDEKVKGFGHHQKAGPQLIQEETRILELERSFPHTVLPVCKAGQKLFEIRTKRTDLIAQRDALKAKREAAVLAAI